MTNNTVNKTANNNTNAWRNKHWMQMKTPCPNISFKCNMTTYSSCFYYFISLTFLFFSFNWVVCSFYNFHFIVSPYKICKNLNITVFCKNVTWSILTLRSKHKNDNVSEIKYNTWICSKWISFACLKKQQKKKTHTN